MIRVFWFLRKFHVKLGFPFGLSAFNVSSQSLWRLFPPLFGIFNNLIQTYNIIVKLYLNFVAVILPLLPDFTVEVPRNQGIAVFPLQPLLQGSSVSLWFAWTASFYRWKHGPPLLPIWKEKLVSDMPLSCSMFNMDTSAAFFFPYLYVLLFPFLVLGMAVHSVLAVEHLPSKDHIRTSIKFYSLPSLCFGVFKKHFVIPRL